ncbi:hypothetical protein K1T71_012305 [Dendrolimus kikuchii]|uniref:Uncharacterized protein n=1 Tax=Dendrolimus kikuchii TaxID=765133 RepID=A0ACC1CLG5_9NEOP|nr:hypothetical protein K1T71_012305 [Dendrolimus kikuchii]
MVALTPVVATGAVQKRRKRDERFGLAARRMLKEAEKLYSSAPPKNVPEKQPRPAEARGTCSYERKPPNPDTN